VFGYLEASEIPGYCGDEEVIIINTIAIVRRPQNVWLWIHFFDDENRHIASVSRTEKDIFANEFSHYVKLLKKNSSQ
jgi:hypothetical protein